jgi:2-phospho-L-lactate guanylyltransferase
VTVAIPIRSFTSGNTRLSRVLDQAGREQLARMLATRAVVAARDAGAAEVLIVSSSPQVHQWAADAQLRVIDDGGRGLDAAAHAALDGIGLPAPWVILHADLPFLTGSALAPIMGAACSGPVIAPSHDGGTSAIGGIDPNDFHYGPASFHAHLAATPSMRVVVDYRLAIDIDTGRDLFEATRVRHGEWLRPLLGSLQ